MAHLKTKIDSVCSQLEEVGSQSRCVIWYLTLALIKSRKNYNLLQSSADSISWCGINMNSENLIWKREFWPEGWHKLVAWIRTHIFCRYFYDLTLPLSVWRSNRHNPQTHLTWLEQEECGIKSLQSTLSSVHFINRAQLDSLKRPHCSGLRFKPLETKLWEH